MQEIGSFAAKSHLSQLLKSVTQGESFAITKHGVIIAFLTPATVKPKQSVAETVKGIMALRKKIGKRGINFTLKEINDMKKAGQK